MTNITGIVVSTGLTAGPDGCVYIGTICVPQNHAEGIVVSTALNVGGPIIQHAEGIVVTTALNVGGPVIQHAEGIVVTTGSPQATATAAPSARSTTPKASW